MSANGVETRLEHALSHPGCGAPTLHVAAPGACGSPRRPRSAGYGRCRARWSPEGDVRRSATGCADPSSSDRARALFGVVRRRSGEGNRLGEDSREKTQ